MFNHLKKYRPKYYDILVISLITFLPTHLLAAENINNFELSPEQLLNATVMSVSKTPEKVMDAPAAIYVITSEDIKRSGATSIPEALRMAPGVDVARVNNSGWAISIRGFNGTLANKLLVLIDGREVYDPLFSGVYWDIQDYPLEDIERIEVVRGPGATLWGSNAVNGVINIITKNAADTTGNLVSLTSGNQETGIVIARHGGKLSDNSYYRLYEKSFYRANQQGENGIDSHDNWKTDRGGFRTDWTNEQKESTFTLQGDAYGNEDGQMRKVTSLSAPFSQTIEEDILARGSNILGRWNKKNDNGSNVTIASYLDYTSRDQALLNDERTTYDLDTQYELPQMGVNKIIVGGKYRLSNDELRQSDNPTISFPESSRTTQTLSGFAQDKITLQPEKWFLTLGSKFENNDYTGFEIEPSARLQWHPDNKDMVWSSVSRAVRTPSRLEDDLHAIQAAAAFNSSVISIDTLPNPNLKSEELVAYELGYRRQVTPDVTLDISSFYNDYSNLITYVSSGITSPPPRYIIGLTPYNNEKAQTYGAETLVDWRASKSFKLSASYSLLEMNVDGPSVSTSNATEEQSPENQFNIRALWDVTEKLSFDTTVYYVSSLPAYQVDEYTRLDMHLGYKITNGVEFNLVGQNLLDNSHREFLSPTPNADGFPVEINRSIYGNITWRF